MYSLRGPNDLASALGPDSAEVLGESVESAETEKEQVA